MDDVQRLCALGVPSQVAQEIVRQIAAAVSDALSGVTSYTDADAVAAVAAKTEVAALDSESLAADIVAALQA